MSRVYLCLYTRIFFVTFGAAYIYPMRKYIYMPFASDINIYISIKLYTRRITITKSIIRFDWTTWIYIYVYFVVCFFSCVLSLLFLFTWLFSHSKRTTDNDSSFSTNFVSLLLLLFCCCCCVRGKTADKVGSYFSPIRAHFFDTIKK